MKKILCILSVVLLLSGTLASTTFASFLSAYDFSIYDPNAGGYNSLKNYLSEDDEELPTDESSELISENDRRKQELMLGIHYKKKMNCPTCFEYTVYVNASEICPSCFRTVFTYE